MKTKLVVLLVVIALMAITVVGCVNPDRVVDSDAGTTTNLYYTVDEEHGVICYTMTSKNGIDCVPMEELCDK